MNLSVSDSVSAFFRFRFRVVPFLISVLACFAFFRFRFMVVPFSVSVLAIVAALGRA
jgi:hypothetical protein